MAMEPNLGIDCGSVSLNLALMSRQGEEPVTIYRRTRGRPLEALVAALDELMALTGQDLTLRSAMVTGSGRELLARALDIPAVNEITAHASGAHAVNPQVRTIIEIGGQDSKFMRIGAPVNGRSPAVSVFRMNEICAAGTGAFLDEQAERLNIPIESFGPLALRSRKPAPIAGRCAVFAKSDMIHQAQEGTPLPDILLGLAFALGRNYLATLVRGEPLKPLVSLQGGVMSNAAVVHAFKQLLDLGDEQVVIPAHHDCLGALGCAVLAARQDSARPMSLLEMKQRATAAFGIPVERSHLAPLDSKLKRPIQALETVSDLEGVLRPLIVGLDVGSVSVKGVVIDGKGRILREDYRLSRSRPLESIAEVIVALCRGELRPDAVAVTGSGRYLVGRLLEADLIVNEITAQAAAALNCLPDADTIVEIGGQDSKWISLDQGHIVDFEMNRVCAAGTGSFLMAQSHRLNLLSDRELSHAAFESSAPADLGTRCTVFMESDLIHHQNNGASSEDLAAGVCISIVTNYLERVANHKRLGEKVLFLGGVASVLAVRAAFEQHTGRRFHTPAFHKVSGALGAALNMLELARSRKFAPGGRDLAPLAGTQMRSEQFTCSGCPNQCRVRRYSVGGRRVFHGGLCERWEHPEHSANDGPVLDLFGMRVKLLEDLADGSDLQPAHTWGMIRSPQFYEWFPFWQQFCRELGIGLTVAPRLSRKQFEQGLRYLRVETCLPIKVLAGQIRELVSAGIKTLFHPLILSDSPDRGASKPLEYCPYTQASSLFFRGAFDVDWQEPFVSFALDPQSLRRECRRFASEQGFSARRADEAIGKGLENLNAFNEKIRGAGQTFLDSLGPDERALVILGKPYHTAEGFLNMNLGSLIRRLGVPTLPGDLFPLRPEGRETEVIWKYQRNIIRVARAVSRDPRLFPVLITFFGCGPDPFTLRHVRAACGNKPLLVLEMDEHSSRAGMLTRLEAFLDRLARHKPSVAAADACKLRKGAVTSDTLENGSSTEPEPVSGVPTSNRTNRGSRPTVLYLPYMCDHSYGFAAAARSVGIDARVLPPPDEESERLGRPHLVGGECHPYALILGDYLKLARTISLHGSERSRFYIIGPDACRLGQFPRYIETVRQDLGLPVGVVWEIEQALEAFGLSGWKRQHVLRRAWEGLHAYDVMLRIFLRIRPFAKDKDGAEDVYRFCRDRLFEALSEDRVWRGMEEVVHALCSLPVEEGPPRPAVAVTGDYYTRVVPYANNEVYREVEELGAILWAPPMFTDCLKIATLRDTIWSALNGRIGAAVQGGLLCALLGISEFKVKGPLPVRRALDSPSDFVGRAIWKTSCRYAHSRLPSGITAPLATIAQDIAHGADGVLNLMTLNCSYGTVVTAALSRTAREHAGIPFLTLVYDGLKKTNEKTRLEAFMEQVWDRFLSGDGSATRPAARFRSL